MSRMFLIGFALSSFIVLFIGNSSVPSFAVETAAIEKHELDLSLEFSSDSDGKGGKAEPKDKGKDPKDPKDKDKWVPIDEGEIPKDESKFNYTTEIKVYKVNPCYVCVGGQCYVKQNC